MKKSFTGKTIALLLGAAMLLAFGGCDGKEPTPTPPQDNDKEVETLADFKIDQSYFKNRAVVFYGDSITYGATLQTGEKRYCEIMAERLDFDLFNKAVSGSALALPRPDKNLESGCTIIERNADLNRQAHIAVLMYGANDFFASNHISPIGDPDDRPERLEDVDSFYGSIRYAVKTLRKENEDLRILFLTPLYRHSPKVNGNMDTIADYSAVIEELAEECDYRVINMYGIFENLDFTPGGPLTTDGVHPNAAGHQLMADFLLNYDQEA